MILLQFLSFLLALRFLFAGQLQGTDETIIEIHTDQYDKYFISANDLEASRFSRRDLTLIGLSAVSNISTMTLLGLSFWAIHECGVNSPLRDCYNKDMAIEYGLIAMGLWILGSVLEGCLSDYRIPALIRLPFAGLAYMVGYAETVNTGMIYTGSLCILSIFSIYFTFLNVLYGKLTRVNKKDD